MIRATGVEPHAEEWPAPELLMATHEMPEMVANVRRYLCLGSERDPEIARALEPQLVHRDEFVGLAPLPRVTIWWDTAPGSQP